MIDNVEDDSFQLDLFSMGLQGDTCTTNKIDLKHIAAIATNRTIEDINADYESTGQLSLEFNDDQLKVIEGDLNKRHSSEKVQHTIEILSGLKKDTTMDAVRTAIVSSATLT